MFHPTATHTAGSLRHGLNAMMLLGCLAVAAPVVAAPLGGNWDLNPTADHPRNSEGSFVRLASGHLLFAYSQFAGGSADESPARIVGIESADDGRSWSAPRVIVQNERGRNVMSVSLLRLQDGRLGLFYIKKDSRIAAHPVARFSTDEGATWSAATPIVSAPGYFELNNDRVIQLSSGRLVAPIGFYRWKGSDPSTYDSLDFRAITMWFTSDDDGRSWREAPEWLANPVPNTTEGLQESGVVELADHSLLGWFRTSEGAQFCARSVDRADSWTPATRSSLVSPTSCAAIKLVPHTQRLLAVWNDHSGIVYPRPTNASHRTPLVIGFSDDGGNTWIDRQVLETESDGCYCYIAVFFSKDALLLGYCAGDSHVGPLNRLRIRRIPYDQIRGFSRAPHRP